MRLDWIHRNFVITTVDKAANNLVLICKKHYLQTALSELNNGPAYRATTLTSERVTNDARDFCNQQQIQKLPSDITPGCPAFHLRAKFHKSVPSFRFVVSAHVTPLQQASRLLTRAFNALMPEADAFYAEYANRIPGMPPTTTSWILHDSAAVTQLARDINVARPRRAPNLHHLQTHDFTTMYTTLPQGDLIMRVTMLVRELFRRKEQAAGRARHSFLWVRQDGISEWVSQRHAPAGRAFDAERDRILSASDICTILKHLVKNTHVEFAGHIWRQHVGIPMGTSCAGQLANLYCLTYEADFMHRLYERRLYHIARSFAYSRRYIDDALSIDNRRFFVRCLYRPSTTQYYNPQTRLPGIYPGNALQLQPADSGANVPYLDLSICQNARAGLYTTIYDKRLDDKYRGINVIRYPHVDTVLASKCLSSILTSQLHRFARLCTRKTDFAYQTALVIHRMLQKGYPHLWIWPKLKRFIAEHPALYAPPTLTPVTAGQQPSVPYRYWRHRIGCRLHRLQTGAIKPGPFGAV
jgi:hypothetical protein